MNLGRVYDEPDGTTRVLVDRLWPRGFRRDDARVDAWLPAVAPSAELRRWYAHDPDRAAEFAGRYRAELDAPAGRAALDELRALVGAGPSTLVTAAREVQASHLPVLAELVASRGEDD